MAGAVRASRSPLAILHLIVSPEISFLHSAWCVCVCVCVECGPTGHSYAFPSPFLCPGARGIYVGRLDIQLSSALGGGCLVPPTGPS